jgi:prephenate dehydrogenase
MKPDVLGVIGLGAMGGSLAWQAARRGVERVIGYSPFPSEGAAALKAGAITELAHDPQSVVRRSELVVLAAPPSANLRLLGELAGEIKGKKALCTDVTSVKLPVVQRASALGLDPFFAGSHPLTGTDGSGFSAAGAVKYRGVVVYVTPLPEGESAAPAIADFWATVLEAAPVFCDAAEHDRMLAWTSHLPQAVASALAVTLSRRGPKGVSCGPGALDTTRLAASSTLMWRDILLLNREAVLEALTGMEEELGTLRSLLSQPRPMDLLRWLEEGRAWRRRLSG